MWVGAATALFSATIAAGQSDIKKVLAYSTISQLGFMVAAVGMGAFVGGMFHLVTHAFFKALLFLSAGSVIIGMERGEHNANHAHGAESKGGKHKNDGKHNQPHGAPSPVAETAPFDAQDMRNMGGLRERMPLTFWVYLIGALALSGIAPLAGFFSKDEILSEASRQSPAVFWVLLAAAFLTAFYMGRQVLMVFFGRPRSVAAEKAEESRPLMTVPLVILAILSVFGGLLNLPFGSTSPAHWLTTWLGQTIANTTPGEFNLVIALTSLGVALVGLFIAWYIYGKSQPLGRQGIDPLQRILGPVFTGMEHKWWVDEFYAAIIVRPFNGLSTFLAQPVDLGIIDGVSRGLAGGVAWTAANLRRLQTGFVRNYAFMVLAGVLVIMSYLMFVIIFR
jgi:NADH-quinone oxidoreductase subunit L